MLKIIAFAITSLGCSTAVFADQADQAFYLGAQYGQQTVDQASWDFGVLSAVAGYQLNEVFAIEGRVGQGIQDEEFVGDGIKAKIGVENSYAMVGKASWKILDNWALYGVAGYSNTSYKLRVNDSGDVFEEKRSENGLMYGAGATFYITSNLSINAEYAVMPELNDDGSKLDIDSLSTSIHYRF